MTGASRIACAIRPAPGHLVLTKAYESEVVSLETSSLSFCFLLSYQSYTFRFNHLVDMEI
jgi:hypothetical protein